MTTKKYLLQAFTIDKLLRARRTQLEDLRDKRFFIGTVLDDTHVQTSHNKGKLSDLSEKYLDLINEYASDEERLLELKAEIRELIEKLDNPTHRLIMEERYINLKRWEDIAADNSYSWQWLHKIHKKALLAIESEYLDMV